MRQNFLAVLIYVFVCFVTAQGGEKIQGESSPVVNHGFADEKTERTQQGLYKEPLDSPQEPIECEAYLLHMEDAILRARNTLDAHLIVVVRAGDGETSRRVARRRLQTITTYLERMSQTKFIVAEGSKVEGRGRSEVYVGGKLLYTIPVRKNSGAVCYPGIGG